LDYDRGVFPIPPVVAGLFASVYTVAALIVGAAISLGVSFALKRKKFRFISGALLGALGFWLGLIGCLLMPWPENTVVYYVGDTRVTETANRFQHPFAVAYVVAVLVPLIYEILRWKHSRTGANSAPTLSVPG
jgi:hypothetical protein